jgi:hypothetical protein
MKEKTMNGSRQWVAGAIGVASVLAMGNAAWAAYLSVDFQGDTAVSSTTTGRPSGTRYYSQGTDTKAVVVDANSPPTAPADPFGGTGNKSLMLEDSSASTDTQVTYGGDSTGLTTGTFSIDFYIVSKPVSGLNRSYMQLRIGTGNATSDADIGILIAVDGTVMSGGIDNAVALDAPHHLVLSFVISPLTHEYSGTLDGEQLKDGTTTSFSFYHPLGEITSVSMKNAVGAATSRAFFDNITLAVPEPASLGLLGLGTMGLLGRRKRRI